MIGVSFREKEYEALADHTWRQMYGTLYGGATQICVGKIGDWAEHASFDGQIAYILENGDPGWGFADRSLSALGGHPYTKRHLRYASHKFTDKGKEKGLEAADYFAWHWCKYYAETVYSPVREMRRDFSALVAANRQKYNVYFSMGEELKNLMEAMRFHAMLEAMQGRLLDANSPNGWRPLR